MLLLLRSSIHYQEKNQLLSRVSQQRWIAFTCDTQKGIKRAMKILFDLKKQKNIKSLAFGASLLSQNINFFMLKNYCGLYYFNVILN